MSHPWIADRMAAIESSGIRKVFDLARTIRDPINLSIGQPDFPVPEAIKRAAIDAIQADRNGYTVTQGVAAATPGNPAGGVTHLHCAVHGLVPQRLASVPSHSSEPSRTPFPQLAGGSKVRVYVPLLPL